MAIRAGVCTAGGRRASSWFSIYILLPRIVSCQKKLRQVITIWISQRSVCTEFDLQEQETRSTEKKLPVLQGESRNTLHSKTFTAHPFRAVHPSEWVGICRGRCQAPERRWTQLESTRRPVNNVYAFSLCVESTGRAVPIKSKHSHSITEKATNAHTSNRIFLQFEMRAGNPQSGKVFPSRLYKKLNRNVPGMAGSLQAYRGKYELNSKRFLILKVQT